MNDILDYNYNNSSTFVCYKDFADSAGYNYPFIPQVIETTRRPTLKTLIAMKEALDNKNLKPFNSICDFFADLEK